MDPRQVYSLLERIDTKLDRVEVRLDSVDVKLAKYNSELEFHIARTNQVEDTLLPIVSHVEQVRGAAKLIGAVGVLLTVIATIYGVLK
jgi:uncharacterized membrane-anchored protein YhcB (DUF1043 family)